MKYYSETLHKLFNTEAEALKAEKDKKAEEDIKLKKEKALKEARATRAKAVETAMKEADAAKAKADKLLKEFVNDYGYFHTSYSLEDVNEDSYINKFVEDVFQSLRSFK